MTWRRGSGMAEMWFTRDAEGRELFVPGIARNTAYVVPDEATRERLYRGVSWWLWSGILASSLILGTRQILGLSLAWDGLSIVIVMAAYALCVRAWTRGLLRTTIPPALGSISGRLAARGANLRGWRLWWRIVATLLGMAIAAHIIRTGIGAPPAVGWLAFAGCALGFLILVGAAWSGRRSRDR